MKNLSLIMLAPVIFSLALAPALALAKEGMAVIVVDVQGDFTTANKGSLAVPNSDQAYLESVAKATEELKKAGLAVYATQDWHPADHMSFASNHKDKKPFETIKLDDGRTQVLWPAHCVQESKGAEILINPALITNVIRKGMNAKFDSYSGFMDDGGSKTDLDKVLKAAGVKTLIIYGIATDYCVKATALNGAKEGYKVVVVQDLCRGVADQTSNAALDEMEQKGVQIWLSPDLNKIKNL